VVRVLHKQGTFLHERSWTLPSYLKSWKPKNGILRVVETGRTNPTIGWSPFLEQTPPQLVRYVYETWLGSDVSGLDLGDSLGRVPVAFDLTGGSGTGFDFFSIVGCEVYATDLTSMNEAVGTLDARNFRALFGMRPVLCDKDRKQKPVRHPDLVLFDPGSRGYPAHSQIYDHVDGEPDEQDFAILDRHDWIDATTRIVKELLTVLAPGGVISFLIRCGVRDRGRVEPDLQLVQDAKAALGDDVCIIEEVVIEYGINRVKQASLAQARVPAVHLLLGRPA
jgi:SAM-dependent methyltransferase